MYSYGSRGWRLSCVLRSYGIPRVIKEVKWFRNGDEISEQNGFTSTQMELWIEVFFMFLKFGEDDINYQHQVR